MATATKKATRKRTAKPAPAPEPEVDETELEDEVEDEDTEDELDELEEDEVEDKPAKAAAQEVTFGVSDLAKLITEKYAPEGKKVTPRELRTLIRKMARDGKGRVVREITPGNRTRYDWPEGTKDPEVRAIIKAYRAGELEADKKEKLDALKARKTKEREDAAKADGSTKKTGKKAASKKSGKPKPPPVEAEDEDDDDLDLDDED